LNHHLVGWAVVIGLIGLLVGVAVWSIQHFKRSPNRAAMAGMMLLWGSFLKVDPPPPPPSERIIKDAEDEHAAGGPPKV
jgi:hypothetical protein